MRRVRIIIRRLLTSKWQLVALLFATVAALSLIVKWSAYPDEHGLAELVHDVSVGATLICSVLAYYFQQRFFVSRDGQRPEESRDNDLWATVQ